MLELSSGLFDDVKFALSGIFKAAFKTTLRNTVEDSLAQYRVVVLRATANNSSDSHTKH